MEKQFIWSDWWKLWPQWRVDTVTDYDFGPEVLTFKDYYFFFGPLQLHWYGASK